MPSLFLSVRRSHTHKRYNFRISCSNPLTLPLSCLCHSRTNNAVTLVNSQILSNQFFLSSAYTLQLYLFTRENPCFLLCASGKTTVSVGLFSGKGGRGEATMYMWTSKVFSLQSPFQKLHNLSEIQIHFSSRAHDF